MTENFEGNQSEKANQEQPQKPDISNNIAQQQSIRTSASQVQKGAIYPSEKSASPRGLTDLYKNWVSLRQSRTDLYRARIDAAWESLLQEISNWTETLNNAQAGQTEKHESDLLAYHHVDQFDKFVQGARTALLDSSSQVAAAKDPAEVEDYRALVVGVFTAQWLLLRDVVLQRVVGSPYRSGLYGLDQQAKGYYARLYDVFKPKLKSQKLDKKYRDNPLASFAPLVYLGNIAQLTVFNRRVPLMLSIPFGALPDMPNNEYTSMAIAHEVTHALFVQVPEMIDEIKSKLKDQLNAEEGLTRNRRVLYDMMIQWVEEICADLFGTALAGEIYATSARWIMAGSDSLTGITDETHPPTVLRPMIHLSALSSIEKASGSTKFTVTRDLFRQELDRAEEPISLLDRQFRSVPALMFIRLTTVSDILIDLIENRLFPMQLESLNNETIASLLSAVNSSTVATLPRVSKEGGFEPWGEAVTMNADEFVLDFPATTAPTLATPGVSNHPDCCSISLLRPLCC